MRYNIEDNITEYAIQCQAVRHLRTLCPDALYTISPSSFRRYKAEKIRSANMGYTRGTPDLMVFVPRGGFYGLFVEIKKTKGRPTPEQLQFVERANRNGYYAVITYGLAQTIQAIDYYFSLSVSAEKK